MNISSDNNTLAVVTGTDMTKGSYSDESARTNREKHTFLSRWVEPRDVVNACLFLCSD